MTETIPDEFLTAFDRISQLPAGMDFTSICLSSEFKNFITVINDHCFARVAGNFVYPYLHHGLSKLGLRCMFDAGSPLAAVDMNDSAMDCYRALNKKQSRQTYLCPLDWADYIPEITFGNATIKQFTKLELDALLNSSQRQRGPFYAPADTTGLSRFTWLVVEHNVELQADFYDRYTQWPQWFKSEDQPGTVYPYNHDYPDAVQRAIFLLMLAPWEEWMESAPSSWSPFDIPWVYTLSDDIFQIQYTVPTASSLTWLPNLYGDDDQASYTQSPALRHLLIDEDKLRSHVDPDVRKGLEVAINRGLINAAAHHQFVKAFQSDGVDAFLAHIVVIDACLGGKSDNNGLVNKLKNLGDTTKLKLRLVGLLNDASAKESMHFLYKARSDYVHGNALEKIPAEHLRLARILARKVLIAVIAAAGTSPDISREELLDGTLHRGWEILGAD